MTIKSAPSRLHPARVAAIVTGTILAAVPSIHAAEFTWTNVTGNWSVPANWAGGVAPSGFGVNDIYNFGGTGATGYTSTHDAGFPYELNVLNLNSSATAPNILSSALGSSLSFVDSSVAATPRISQSGTGEFVINIPFTLQGGLNLLGAPGSGLVTLGGAIEGFEPTKPVTITGGKWRFAATGNTWSGGTVITGGAQVEVRPAAPEGGGNVNAAISGGGSGLGIGGTITLNNGSLKLTPQAAGNLTFGTDRTIAFGIEGGLLDLVNLNGGNVSGDLALSTANGATGVAVIRFNGGVNGLSSNNPTNGDWQSGTNTLRLRSLAGTGPVRIELTNGATFRGATGAAGTVEIPMPTTIRGALGGNPTSPTGEKNINISRDTGRVVLDGLSIANYSAGLVLENALQIHTAGASRALDGNITIAGIASGNPGYIAFSGRGTGTALGTAINEPGANAAGQNVLWVGRDGNDTLTVQDGGIAVLDARIRYDQGNSNGVLLNARTVLESGGTLRFYQSLSNATAASEVFRQGQTNFNTNANVGNHIVQGNITGQGTTAKDSVIDLYLPVGNTIGAAPAGGSLPYGGVVFDPTSNLVVNGTGFGGLRINGLSRANTLFAGGNADPISNSAKVANLLSPARVAALTGSGGYLTAAAQSDAVLFPNAEWAPGVNVGLRVLDSNSTGVDLSFDPGKTSWGHNLVVDAGARLSTGSAPFTMAGGSLQGTGTVDGNGGFIIASGATISPGLDSLGTLTVGNLTLSGTYLAQLTTQPASDLVNVNGDLSLGGTSVLQIAPGSALANSSYTLLTYTGALTGTFGSMLNVPVGFSLSYDIPGQVRLISGAPVARKWNGAPAAVWSTSGTAANWQGGTAFANGNQVVFDDSATGSTTVTISGTVNPDVMQFDNSTKNYVIIGSAGNSIVGNSALLKDGTGVVELRGSHSFTGGANVTQGTLRLANDEVLPDTSSVTIAAGATLDLTGKTETILTLNLGGTSTAGTLNVTNLNLTGAASVASNLVLSGNIVKTGTGTATVAGTVNLGGAERTLEVAGGTEPSMTISGVVSNGSLNKIGDGTLRLNAANTYAGGTVVGAGKVIAGVAQAIPNGALQIAAGATVDMSNADFSATTLSGSGTLIMGDGDLTLNPATSAAFLGPINGSGVVTKIGSGVQTLGGVSDYLGGLHVMAGRVNLANADAAGLGPVDVDGGAILQLGATIPNFVNLAANSTVSSQTPASVGSGGWDIQGPVTFRLQNLDTNGSSDIIFTGALNGSGPISVLGNPAQSADGGPGFRLRGTLISTYDGTITAGERAKFEIQMGSSAAVNPLGEAKIVMTAGTTTGGLNGTYSQLQPRMNGADQTHVMGNDVTISGQGYVNVNVLGAANIVAEFGTLSIGEGQILAANKNDRAIRTVAFQEVALTGGMAEFRAYDPVFGVQTNADRGGANIRLGVISQTAPGSGIISKSNELWSVEVAGVSSYTGPTDIQEGTLRVSAAGSIATSSEIRVGAGTTFDVTPHADGYAIPAAQKVVGSGAWNGRLVLGGTLAPGPDIVTMSGGNLTLQGTALMQFQLSGVDNTSDKLALTGSFDKGTAGAFQFDFEGGGLNGTTYSLVSFTGTTFSASDFSYVDLGPGLAGTFQLTGTELRFSVVPEPGSAVAFALGASLLGLRRRRRS